MWLFGEVWLILNFSLLLGVRALLCGITCGVQHCLVFFPMEASSGLFHIFCVLMEAGLVSQAAPEARAKLPTRCFSLCQFALQEEKRQKAERLHQQQKHESQMKDMQAQCESNTNELQHLQVLIPHGLVSQSCLGRSQSQQKWLQRTVRS